MLGPSLLVCSECGLVETELLECPNCRSRRLKRQVASPRPKFQTSSRLRFDIDQTDSLAIDVGERICLVGKCSTLVDRLCITALLPERHHGFGSHHVVIIDAGNQSDIYQCVNFARQYGLDIKDILRRIVVSYDNKIHNRPPPTSLLYLQDQNTDGMISAVSKCNEITSKENMSRVSSVRNHEVPNVSNVLRWSQSRSGLK